MKNSGKKRETKTKQRKKVRITIKKTQINGLIYFKHTH